MLPKRIRIVADGSKWGTEITDADTGEKLGERIKAIQFHHNAGKHPYVEVTLHYVFGQFEIDASAEIVSEKTDDEFQVYPCAEHTSVS